MFARTHWKALAAAGLGIGITASLGLSMTGGGEGGEKKEDDVALCQLVDTRSWGRVGDTGDSL